MNCPRCNGPLAIREELDGREVACIACGFRPTRPRIEPEIEDSDVGRVTHRSYMSCKVSPSCFTCPLDRCIYEMTSGEVQHANAAVRYGEMRERLAAGASYRQVQREFGVSWKTVRRAIEEGEVAA